MALINVSKIAHLSGHQGAIYTLCKGILPNQFFSAGADGFIVEWDMQDLSKGKLLAKISKPIYALFISQQNQLLYCGTADGNLHVIDLKNRLEIRNIEAHKLGIFDIKTLGDLLITAGGDGMVKIWNLNDLTLLQQLELSNKSARSLSVNDAQQLVAVGLSDGTIQLLDINNNFVVKQRIEAHSNSVFSVAFYNNLLLSGGRDAKLNSWLISDFCKQEQSINAHTLHINSIAFNPSGNLCATGSMDKTIKIWQTKTLSLLKVIDHARNTSHINSVNKCIWLNEQLLSTASDDRTVMLWQVTYF